MDIGNIKTDCWYFRGDVPCKPSKQYRVTCNDCTYYKKSAGRILIIKLGAAGDVIRTTPLLFPLKRHFPDYKVFWLTYYTELLPQKSNIGVDEPLLMNFQNALYLQQTNFDILINLDKDREALALASKINAKTKYGFYLKDGICYPLSSSAQHKYLTGIFDVISKANIKSYLQEIFEICGYKYNGEEYILELDDSFNQTFNVNKSKKIVGLNTGCGSRWSSRLWSDSHWLKLIELLLKNNYEVVLLGGEYEDLKNRNFAEITNAKYFGYFPIKTFLHLVNKCDLIVTQVTMALHIAIGLQKKIVLMNNIFNSNEFELFGRGIIVQPSKECRCYFSPRCINPEYNCMDFLYPEDVFNSVNKLLS
ncbi:MAG: glycosyltransferase family 9 protein [Ignavibacteria bacterium]